MENFRKRKKTKKNQAEIPRPASHSIFFGWKGWKKAGKMGEDFWKRKKTKKNQPEIRRFTSTIQMVLNSPLSWTLIAVQKKGSYGSVGEFFLGFKLINIINIENRPA